MKWLLTRLWMMRQPEKRLDEKKKRDALKLISSPPVRDYLIELMRELVREGIYLSPERQEGARHTIELLKGEIAKGDKIFKQDK